jgi:hypothetical protein
MNWRVANWILLVRFRPGIAIMSLENKDSNKHFDLLPVGVFLCLPALMPCREVS